MRRASLVLLLAVGACGGDLANEPGHAHVVSTPVVGTDAKDVFDANAVVNLATASFGTTTFCTGVLLSRTRVLTASHCVGALQSPNVSVGSVPFGTTEGYGFPTLPNPTSELGRETDPASLADTSADLAILALDEAPLTEDLKRILGGSLVPAPYLANDAVSVPTMIDDSEWGTMLGVHVERPSFEVPSAGRVSFASWRGSDRTLHQLDVEGTLGGPYFVVSGAGADLGDSGSPIFVTRADGSRDPFGILSGGHDDETYFVGVAAPTNAAFIEGHMIDVSRRGHARWLAMHPRADGGEWWVGEDEYSGPCDVANDADCDHWTDAHDDCPHVFDHDQADADDDGVGDACAGP